ncbi:methyl-accepting chemotaxis protein [Halomonas organivorans]
MQMSIKQRIILMTVALIVLSVVVGIVGTRGIEVMDEAIETIYADRLVPSQQLGNVDVLVRDNIFTATAFAADGLSGNTDAASRERMLEEVAANQEAEDAIWAAYMATHLTPREAELAERYAEQREVTAEAIAEGVALIEQRDYRQAVIQMGQEARPAFEASKATLQKLLELQTNVAQRVYGEAKGSAGTLTGVAIGAILLAVILGALLGWRLIVAIVRPLSTMQGHFGAIAEGNLSTDIDASHRDELGQAMAALASSRDQQRDLVQQIREAVMNIQTAAGEIADGNEDLSQRTEQQASSLQETAASMEEVTSTVKHNADNTEEANRLAAGAQTAAEAGAQKTTEAASKMHELGESSEKVSGIISVIDGIAFQTNILALNASVEAARAGEHGRGFAVVAEEVRSLAQRSAAAAKEIQELVTHETGLVKDGASLVQEANGAMEEIAGSIRQVASLMDEITRASNEQSRAIEQVGVAVTQMDQVTQQNASLVEQAAAAADSLKQEANRLAGSVNVFRLGGDANVYEGVAQAESPSSRLPAPKREVETADDFF